MKWIVYDLKLNCIAAEFDDEDIAYAYFHHFDNYDLEVRIEEEDD